jgi:hypothetical protein
MLQFLGSLPNFIGKRYQQKKKSIPPKLVEVSPKKISARSAQPFWRKRGKTFFCYSKTDFEKNSKY